MKLKDLQPKVDLEFIEQNKEYSVCEVCKGKGYASFYFNICLECIGKCEGCIFTGNNNRKVKLSRIDICCYCSGTGYRTWIDEIKWPYPLNDDEWVKRPVPTL